MTELITIDPKEYLNKEYVFRFDENNLNWTSSTTHTNMFLKATSNYLNTKLAVAGYVFLNDALRDLGLSPIGEGQLVGWHEPSGRAYVDMLWARNLSDDPHESRTLDILFKVDGLIYDRI